MFQRLSNLDPDFSFGAIAVGPEPLFLLLFALALDAVIGFALRRIVPLTHPERWIERLTLGLERRLNRQHRGGAARLIRGLLLVIFVAAVAAASAVVLGVIAGAVSFGWALVLIVILGLISQHRPFAVARAIARRLEEPDAMGRETLARPTGQPDVFAERAAMSSDAYAVARGGVEHLADRFATGLVGASFWFVLLGLPGLVVYRALGVVAYHLDEAQPRFGLFGFVPTRLSEALSWVPVRLAGALLATAAVFVPGAKPGVAFSTMVRQAPRHPSRGAAWPLAATAGALGLSLSGPKPVENTGAVPWIEPAGGRARATSLDVRRALFLYGVACLLNAALVILATMAWLASASA